MGSFAGVGEPSYRRLDLGIALDCEAVEAGSDEIAEEREAAFGERDRTLVEGNAVLVDLFRQSVSNMKSTASGNGTLIILAQTCDRQRARPCIDVLLRLTLTGPRRCAMILRAVEAGYLGPGSRCRG